MEDILEFITVNWVLASVFVVLVIALYMYEAMKAGKSVGTQGLSDLVNRNDALILDIRDTNDFKKGHIIDAKNIPLRDVEGRLSEINSHQEKPIVVVCKLGQSAAGVTKLLKSKGFTQVYKLSGGMSEWSAANLPIVKS